MLCILAAIYPPECSTPAFVNLDAVLARPTVDLRRALGRAATTPLMPRIYYGDDRTDEELREQDEQEFFLQEWAAALRYYISMPPPELIHPADAKALEVDHASAAIRHEQLLSAVRVANSCGEEEEHNIHLDGLQEFYELAKGPFTVVFDFSEIRVPAPEGNLGIFNTLVKRKNRRRRSFRPCRQGLFHPPSKVRKRRKVRLLVYNV